MALKNTTVKLRVQSVDPEGLRAELDILDGKEVIDTTVRRFSFADLGFKEKYNRLGKEETPEREILRGLLLWSQEAPDMAVIFFQQSNTLLGDVLVNRVDALLPQ